jgi:hypothetical protein
VPPGVLLFEQNRYSGAQEYVLRSLNKIIVLERVKKEESQCLHSDIVLAFLLVVVLVAVRRATYVHCTRTPPRLMFDRFDRTTSRVTRVLSAGRLETNTFFSILPSLSSCDICKKMSETLGRRKVIIQHDHHIHHHRGS